MRVLYAHSTSDRQNRKISLDSELNEGRDGRESGTCLLDIGLELFTQE